MPSSITAVSMIGSRPVRLLAVEGFECQRWKFYEWIPAESTRDDEPLGAAGVNWGLILLSARWWAWVPIRRPAAVPALARLRLSESHDVVSAATGVRGDALVHDRDKFSGTDHV